jgi:hypothetical protein
VRPIAHYPLLSPAPRRLVSPLVPLPHTLHTLHYASRTATRFYPLFVRLLPSKFSDSPRCFHHRNSTQRNPSFASYSPSNFHTLLSVAALASLEIIFSPSLFHRLFLSCLCLITQFHRLTRPGFVKCIDLVSYSTQQVPAVGLISDLVCRSSPPPRDPPLFLLRARSRQQILLRWQTNTRSISTL